MTIARPHRKPPVHSAAGFTLIELVIVITVLGILAAVALPRFVAVQKDARIAKLQAARGAVKAAATMVHGVILARAGVTDSADCPGTAIKATNAASGAGTVCTEDGVVNTNNGYPEAIATADIGTTGNAGILAAAGLTSVFNPTVDNLKAEGYTVTGTATQQEIQILGATTPADCSFTYNEPTALGAAAQVSGAKTSGC